METTRTTVRSAAGEFATQARRPGGGNAARAWRRFRANTLVFPAVAIVVIFGGLAAAAPLVAAHVVGFEPTEQNLMDNFAPPSRTHWLGTDEYGRDVLIRLIYGGRVSLMVAVLATAATVAVGTLLGATAAFYGGWVDAAIMRAVDVLICIPGFYVLILLSALVRPGPTGLAVIIALFGWYGLARLIRAEVLSVRRREFVTAAQVIGAPNRRILLRHVIPNVAHLVVVFATAAAPGYIVAEAGLSFLGLGVQPPTASWGNMLTNATQYFYRASGLVYFPGLALILTVLALTVIGNALRDALDPRLTA